MSESSKVLYNKFYKRIEASLSKSNNMAALRQFFGEVISRNNEALSSPVPDKAIYMDSRIERKYFDAIGIEPNEVLQALKESDYIDDEWHTVKNPMYVTLILLVIYFNNKNKQDMVQQTMFICSIYMYRNVRSKYFKRTNEGTVRIMNYTISRLSYKNDIKACGSIYKTIAKKSEVFLDNWFKERKSETTGVVGDDVICRMINDNHRRYSTLMNNFYAEFKIDSESGNYMNVDQDIDDEDNYVESDNVSFMVEKNTQKVMNTFILSSYPNPKILQQIAAREPGCSINNLRNMTNYLYDGHDKEFENIVRVIIQIYLFEYKKKVEDLKTPDFEYTMRKHFKKQMSSDKNLNELRKFIDKVMNESGLAKKISRKATLNDCKRALFLYIVVYIRYTLLG